MPKKKKQKPFKTDLTFDELIDLSLSTPPLKKGKAKPKKVITMPGEMLSKPKIKPK